MWAVAIAAVWSFAGFLLRTVVFKLVAFSILYAVVLGFVAYLQGSGLLPTAASMSGAFGGLSSGLWYFLDLFAISVGLPIIVGAWLTRFIIRRIPIIG